MSQEKFDHREKGIIYANLHLPPREIEFVLNEDRAARGMAPTTFTRDNKRDYKRRAQEIDVLEHVPELEAEQRARELKSHLDVIQAGINALKSQAIKNPSDFGKGEARELASLSREFRNTLNDIGALSPTLLRPPEDDEEEANKPTVEEKYAGQLPDNVKEFPTSTGTD